MIDIKKAEALTDEEIVSLSLKNKEYFLLLINRYKTKLYIFIRRISNIIPEDAEDLLQEIFLKIYLNLNDFDQDLKFSSWAYAIARHLVISHHRKLQARAEGHLIDFEDDSLKKIIANVDTQRSVDLKILKDIIIKILNNLDEKYREVLVLKYLEEKNYQEISDIIKRPIGTVGSLLNQAKVEFKKEINKQNIKL